MPFAIRLSAAAPWVVCIRIFSAAATAASAAAAAHVGERLGLGLGDLGFRHLGAAGDELLDLALGLAGETLGLDPGADDDGLGFLLGLLALLADIASAPPAPRTAGGGLRRAPA